MPNLNLEQVESLIIQGRLDEALTNLNKIPNSDQIKTLLLKSEIYYRQSNVDESISMALESLKFASKEGNVEYEIEAMIQLTLPLRIMGEFDQAMDYLSRAEEKFHVLNDHPVLSKLEAKILDNKGMLLMEKGQLEAAYDYCIRGLNIRLEIDDPAELEKSYNCIGIIHANQGNIEQSKKYFEKSLKLRKEIGNPIKIAAAMSNIATCWYYLGRIDLSIEQNKRVLDIYIEHGNNSALGVTLNNIGSDYATIGELDLALENFNRSLDIYLDLGNSSSIALAYTNIGDVYRLRGNYEIAIDFYKRALKLRREVGNALDISSSLYYLVTIYLEIDDIEQANIHFNELEQLYKKSDNKVIKLEYTLSRADLFKHTKRMKNKIEAQKMYEEIIEEEVIDQQLTLTAIINLCELLIEELRIYGEIEIIDDIREQIETLIEFGKNQHSFLILAEAYLLQSKLSLIEGDIEVTKKLLNQAQFIAEEKGLTKLAIKISDEHDMLINNLDTWNSLINENAAFSERIDHVNLQDQLHRMLRKSSEEIVLKGEKPVSFLILGNNGLALFSRTFIDSLINENLLSSFLSAINAFGQEAFQSKGGIERIKHDDYSILMQTAEPLVFCYVFEGQSYTARQKLNKAILQIQKDEVIWNEIVKTLSGFEKIILARIDKIIEKIFVS